LRKEDKVRYGPRITLKQAMTEGAIELYGVTEDKLKRHHVIPKSARGTSFVIGGENFQPSRREINNQANRVPVPDGYHGLGHLMCELVFRANGNFELAREHHHTAIALIARAESYGELVNIAVARVIGGCLVQRLYGVPGERRNWGRANG